VSVFLDTGVFYALQGSRTSRHDAAHRALDVVLDGTYGRVVTSDYVLDEAVTLVRSRTGDFDQAVTVVDRVLGRNGFPAAIDLLYVDGHRFERTIDVFERYEDQPLSFTDASTIAIVRDESIDSVLAFDDDFDGLVDRLDPRDL
jgi:predicted nucleic acid-binding protein